MAVQSFTEEELQNLDKQTVYCIIKVQKVAKQKCR